MAFRSLLILLILASAVPVRANACDFSGAERVAIGDYETWRSRESTDAAVIDAPGAWVGATWWQADETAALLAFYDLPLRYMATFWRGRETVGMIEVRGNHALLMDEDGKVAGSDVWHGCAALVLGADEMAWFTRGE